MGNEIERSELRWYHIRGTKITQEYVGGLVAGFGLGSIVMAYLFVKNILVAGPTIPFEIWFSGFILIAIGSTVARLAQQHTE